MLEVHPYHFIAIVLCVLIIGFSAGLVVLWIMGRLGERRIDQICSQACDMMHRNNDESQRLLGNLGVTFLSQVEVLGEEIQKAHGRYWAATSLLMGAKLTPAQIQKALETGGGSARAARSSIPTRTRADEAGIARKKRMRMELNRGTRQSSTSFPSAGQTTASRASTV